MVGGTPAEICNFDLQHCSANKGYRFVISLLVCSKGELGGCCIVASCNRAVGSDLIDGGSLQS